MKKNSSIFPGRGAPFPTGRSLLPCFLLALPLAACGGDLVVRTDTPLLIEETFPASGAQVPVEALGTLRAVFSADLGARAATDEEVRQHFSVEISEDGQQWTAVPIAAYGYEQGDQTFVLTLGRDTLDRLGLGWEIRLGVRAGLTAVGGLVLARDRYFFFQVGS